MRELTLPSRRRFGQGLGSALALAGLPRALPAQDGTHGARVRIARFAFGPAAVEVVAGDSVTWVNDDLAPHTATAEDGAWDTGPLGRGRRGRIAFETPGEHAYFCAFHPHMRGTIRVRPRPAR